MSEAVIQAIVVCIVTNLANIIIALTAYVKVYRVEKTADSAKVTSHENKVKLNKVEEALYKSPAINGEYAGPANDYHGASDGNDEAKK